ncbi:MAG: threonine synthase [Rhodospirillales bacterium]|nr:threonine synthase [Rhodospirillales bacterium]
MRYISTRGHAPVLPFDDVLLAGLARDGGLYLPEVWPRFSRADIRALRGLSYAELAFRVIRPYVGGTVSDTDLERIIEDAYAAFDHSAVAPMKQLGHDKWLMELFHGPTLSFKDYALQVVGRLFDHVLKAKGQRVTIIGATSGDTGSAAIEACRDRDAIDIFILHPNGRVSDVQRRQMTTVDSANVHNLAIDGNFDDCQDLVKAMFNDIEFRDRFNLSAVNSINWARIMVQIAYYFAAAIAVGAPDRKVTFAVPTGNFGNVFAGYAARRMGLGIPRFIIGSNSNDILTRFFAGGTMETAPVVPTLSPSMDIQISSNFERLLFEYYGRKGGQLDTVMHKFRESGKIDFGAGRWQRMRKLFNGMRLDDSQTKQEIGRIFRQTEEALDPHSIIGYVAGETLSESDGSAMVALATAHPAKFPEAVEEATGRRPGLPPRLADLFDRPEHFDVLSADAAAIKDFIASRMAGKQAA